jgi:hypothetical protein
VFVPRAETQDPDAVVAGGLGVPVGFTRQTRRAIEEAFKDHPVGLSHVAAYILNYSDTPEFAPFVNWVKNHKSMILRSFRLPRYVAKTLGQMSSGGCSLILHERVVRFNGEMCYEMLAAIAAVLLYMIRIYARHGVWAILEEGAGVGDIHVVFKGENNVVQQ